MKGRDGLIALGALLVCLGIFVIYRSPGCAVNVLAEVVVPGDLLTELRRECRERWPAPDFVKYQLPGGLWVLAATLLSWRVCVMVGGVRADLGRFPVAIAAGFEAAQWAGLTDGTADSGDLVFVCAGYFAARALGGADGTWVMTSMAGWRGACCLGSHGLLFLADFHR